MEPSSELYGGQDTVYDEETVGSEFAERPEETTSRRLLVVLLDVSASMGRKPRNGWGAPIDELNERFQRLFASGELQRLTNTELAIAAFNTKEQNGSHVPRIIPLPMGVRVRTGSPIHWAGRVPREYRDAQGKDRMFVADGGTPLGSAVSEALDWIATRLDQWDTDSVGRDCRPVLVVLTDGEPWPNDAQALSAATAKVRAMEDANDLAFWIAGTAGANASAYSELAARGNFIELGSKAIESFVRLMSVSVNASREADHQSVAAVYELVKKKLTQRERESKAGE